MHFLSKIQSTPWPTGLHRCKTETHQSGQTTLARSGATSAHHYEIITWLMFCVIYDIVDGSRYVIS